MTVLSKIRLYATHPHECSYLQNHQATTLFIDPNTIVNKHLYSELADLGFRRSGTHIYKPHCQQCGACVPARIPVQSFNFKRRFKRIWQKNQDITVVRVNSIADAAYFQLYQRYINSRHADGDMFPPSQEQYDSFLTNQWEVTHFYVFSLAGKPVAVAVTDEMEQGLSAIYTFYEPELDARSLGVYAVLWQIMKTRELQLPYLYLGYWIKDCQKMSYKINYRPLELLINKRWLMLN